MIKIINENVDDFLNFLEYKYPTNEDCYINFDSTKSDNSLLYTIANEYCKFYQQCIDTEYTEEERKDFVEQIFSEFNKNL